jgi:hypothetical protein
MRILLNILRILGLAPRKLTLVICKQNPEKSKTWPASFSPPLTAQIAPTAAVGPAENFANDEPLMGRNNLRVVYYALGILRVSQTKCAGLWY